MNQQRMRDYKYIRNTLPKKTLPDSWGISGGDFYFYIDSTIYYAEVNMTWNSWVNSIFNKDGYKINNGTVVNNDNLIVVNSGSRPVQARTKIIENHTYQTT